MTQIDSDRGRLARAYLRQGLRLALLCGLALALTATCRAATHDEVGFDEAGFQTRARALIHWVAAEYIPPGSSDISIPQPAHGVPDPQKYIWPKVMARLWENPKDAWSLAALGQFWDAGGEPAPHAASFYHFAAYGLIRLLCAFPSAVSPYRDAILRRAMREDPFFGRDGTENQIAMLRTSGYLFAQEAGNRAKMAAMKSWIGGYAARLYALGQGEFDSSTYLAFDIASWLNLFDYARDSQVVACARAVLDYYAAGLALKWVNGVQAGGEKRGDTLRSKETVTSYVGWIWWGTETFGTQDARFLIHDAIYSMIPAVSAYRPPAAIVALAHRAGQRRAQSYHNSRPDYLMQRSSETYETLWVTPHYSVGALYSPIGGWGGGDTQETLWKFAAGGDGRSEGAYVVGGAGASYAARNNYNGEGHGPWDQVAQYKDMVLQITCVPAESAALTTQIKALFAHWKERSPVVSFAQPSDDPMAYVQFPAEVTVVEHTGVLFLNCGGSAYAAVRPLNGVTALCRDCTDLHRVVYCSRGGRGELLGFAYEFGDVGTDGSAQRFQEAVLRWSRLETSTSDRHEVTYRDRHGKRLRARFSTSGTYIEPEYDWGPQPTWPQGEGHGRMPQVWQDNRPLNLTVPWPVYDGPGLSLKNGVLTVHAGGLTYRTALPTSLRAMRLPSLSR